MLTYPRAITAGAPGQYRQSAAPRAPGHGRPLDGGGFHDRLSAAPYRHRILAGRPAPAAPGNLAPHSCHSQHPDLPEILFNTHQVHLAIQVPHDLAPPRVRASSGTPPALRPTPPSPCGAGGPFFCRTSDRAQSWRRKPPSTPPAAAPHRCMGFPGGPADRLRHRSPSLLGKGPGVRSALPPPPLPRPCPPTHYPCPEILPPLLLGGEGAGG